VEKLMARRLRRCLLVAIGALTVSLIPHEAGATIEEAPVRTGLSNPAAFTFDPGGRIFYGERLTGRIKFFTPGMPGDPELFYRVTDVSKDTEQGLLGLAVHPDYPTEPFVYAYATRLVDGRLRNQLIRIRASGDRGVATKVLLQSPVSADGHHNGGRILFGPDGNLYVVIGEARRSGNAQNLSNVRGKVLRMAPDGSVPPDNPFPGSFIYGFGIRNSFGLAFDPLTDALWETEAGPECNDEVNRIVAGGNHGWGPEATCSTSQLDAPYNTNQSGPEPIILPKTWYTPVITPTGLAFCDGCGLASQREGRLYVGSFNVTEIRELRLSAGRNQIVDQQVVLDHGRSVLSMETAPNGRIFFSDAGGIHRLRETA
jgi:glucose/arabinose dehydrogenase